MKTFTKKTIIIFATFFVSLISQAQTVEWANRFGGSNGSDTGVGVATDASGNIYSIGYFADSGTFGSFTLTTSGSNFDAFVTKTNSSGTVLWAKNIGGTSQDFSDNIIVDAAGNIYVTGTFQGVVTFGSFTLTSVGFKDIFLCKMDPLGNVLLAKQYTGSSNCYVSGLCNDALGSIYAVGSFSGTATFGTFTLASAGNMDGFIIKLDASGNVIWFNKVGGTGQDNANSVKADASNNIYVTGTFLGMSAFGPTLLTSTGNNDAFVSKITSGGTFVWAKQFGGTGFDYGSSISINSSGNIYIGGGFQSPSTFGSVTFTSGSCYVSQIDAAGTVLWANKFTGNTALLSLASDPTGNIYSTGFFNGTSSFGTNTLVAAVLNSNSFSDDAFISKLDATGNFVWVKQLSGTDFSPDKGNSITYNSGKVYTTGDFNGTGTIDNFSITAQGGSSNAFLVKVSSDPVGLKENLKNIDVKIYPNPVSDKLVIESEEFDQNLNVSVTDLLGKEVLNKSFINSKTETLDVSTLLPGIYFLRVNSNEKSGVVKIVKE